MPQSFGELPCFETNLRVQFPCAAIKLRNVPRERFCTLCHCLAVRDWRVGRWLLDVQFLLGPAPSYSIGFNLKYLILTPLFGAYWVNEIRFRPSFNSSSTGLVSIQSALV